MKKHFLYWLMLGLIVIIGCQKELSFEVPTTPAGGSLQDDAAGDCLPKTVNGTYVPGQALVPATNTITVQVNVTKTGAYTVYTDTVNGYYFRTTGSFTTLGNNTVTLRGNGTPFASGTNNFVVTFDSTVCDIQVVVTSPGFGTLAGAPNACAPITVNGTYGIGVALTMTNNAVVQVNVTTAGAFSITTDTVAGVWFTFSGSLAAGAQSVTLQAQGGPPSGTAGNKTFTVRLGASLCTFAVTVAGPGAGRLGGSPGACAPITVNGIYTNGTPLTAANNVVVQVNVTTPGVIIITTNTAAGFSFGFTGNLAAGTQNVTLLAVGGPPSGSGAQNFTVTLDTSTCTFTVMLAGPGVGRLVGDPGACTGATLNGTYLTGVALTSANTADVQVNVTTAGSFSITTNTVNGYSFAFSGSLALGTQTVTLVGTGTPVVAGTNAFTVTIAGTPPSTCTFNVTVQLNDYFPRTTGSNWSYEFDNDPLDSLYRTVIAATLAAPGGTYNIFMGDDGTGLDSSGYYRKSGGDYSEWLDVGGFIGYDNPLWAQYIMLKDNVAMGTNWKSSGFSGTVSGTPLTLRFSYTVTQKDVPASVTTSLGTLNFTNVIVVEEKYEQEVSPGVWQDITSLVGHGESYYARGIGLVKFEFFDGTGASVFLMELRRHQVL
ncbi:MAG: hypothetical protein ACT4OJ_02630 [Bacteroidota bacterium]